MSISEAREFNFAEIDFQLDAVKEDTNQMVWMLLRI